MDLKAEYKAEYVVLKASICSLLALICFASLISSVTLYNLSFTLSSIANFTKIHVLQIQLSVFPQGLRFFHKDYKLS